MGGALWPRKRAVVAPDPTPPDPSDAAYADLILGLHGDIDVPRGELITPGRTIVGGWVFHEDHVVRQVVVAYGRELMAIVAVGEPRPDVQVHHRAHPAAARAGWTVEIDYPGYLHGEVDIQAYAVIEVHDGHDERLGPLLRFGSVVVDARTFANAHGELTRMDPAPAGYVEVAGTARHPAGLTRVEVSIDGGQRIRARHSLPGRVPLGPVEAGDHEVDVAGFSAFVELPLKDGGVSVDVEVTGRDGTVAALVPMTVDVLAPPQPESLGDPDRSVIALRGPSDGPDATGRPRGPRRVLVFAHDLRIGGAQLYLHLLVKELRAKGLELCLVAGAGGPFQEELENDLGVPVIVLGVPPVDHLKLELYMAHIRSFASSHDVAAGLGNTLLAFPAIYALQQMGLPTTWVIHESFEPASFFRQYYGVHPPDSVVTLALSALRDSDEVVFVAAATRDLYAPYVDDDSASVVPYGVELGEIDAFLATHDQQTVRSDLSLGASSRILVCVGMVEPRKGQLALVRAFARLSAQTRKDAELVLVGMDNGPYAAAVRTFVETAALKGVRFVDVDPDVLRWHLASDVLVSASDVESMPRSMLEAMALGRCVAATDVFGVGEIVTDGVTGFTCEALDLAALTDMLRRVLEADQDDIERRGAAAHDLVRSRHHPDGYTRHFVDRLTPWLAGDAPSGHT